MVVKGKDGLSEADIIFFLKSELKGIRIDKIKTTKAKSVVINLPDPTTCQQAKNALGACNETRMTTSHTKKVFPKIMVTNVSMDEACETAEDRLEFANIILQKNSCLNECSPEDITVVATKEKTRYRYKVQNVIIKCSPKARRAIRANEDIIYTTYGRHRVFDHYHVLICNFCQGYGHIESDCKKKDEGSHRTCGKCMGKHDTKDCVSTHVKCSQCHKRGYTEVDHFVFHRGCPCYKEMENRLASNTDHGLQQ